MHSPRGIRLPKTQLAFTLRIFHPQEEVHQPYWEIIKKAIEDETLSLPDNEVSKYYMQLITIFGPDLKKINTLITSLEKSDLIPQHESHHTAHSIPYVFRKLLHFKNTLEAEEECLHFLMQQNPQTFQIFYTDLLQTGFTQLVKTQDPNQAYHTLLHALEMCEDSYRKMDLLIKEYVDRAPQSKWGELAKNASPLCLFVAALAAFHDIIQNKGQYHNEFKSAQIFWQFFKKTYITHFKIEPPAELATLAENIIIDGTLLNITTDPQRENTSLDIIQKRARLALQIPEEKADSAHFIFSAATSILSLNDTHRAANKAVHALKFPTTDGNLPEDLEELLKTVFIEGLCEKDFNKAQAEALVKEQLPVFKILIGQNLRMQADGPFRQFKDEPKCPAMQTLMQLFDNARLAKQDALSRKQFDAGIAAFIEQGLDNLFISNLIGPNSQCYFSAKQNNQQVQEFYQITGHKVMADILESQTITPTTDLPKAWHDKLKNVWNVHAALLLPILHAALLRNDKRKHSILSAVIFCAANQQGLDLLASQPKLLASLYHAVYGIIIDDNLDYREARLNAAAFMKLAQSKEAKPVPKISLHTSNPYKLNQHTVFHQAQKEEVNAPTTPKNLNRITY